MRGKTVLVMMLTLLLAGMLTSAFSAQPVISEPQIWTVDDDGPADFSSIQEAINSASSGDTIYVKAGTYYENVVVNKTLSLIGENRKSIIDGNGTGIVTHITANKVNITEFTIQNSGWYYGYSGICVDDSINSTLRNNNITGNWNGIRLEASSNTLVVNNNSTNNWSIGIIMCSWSSNNVLVSNKVEDNSFGIELDFASENTFVENKISNNRKSGFWLQNSHYNKFTGNNITNNGRVGFMIFGATGCVLRNNTMSGNGWGNFGVCPLDPHENSVYNDIDTSNTVEGKPIYYWVSKQNQTVPREAGYVGLINSTKITIEGLNLENNYQSVLVVDTKNSLIKNNNITNNTSGIELDSSDNNTLIGNNIQNSRDGIDFWVSSNNTILGNNITNSLRGIRIYDSNNNTIAGNNVTNGDTGIWLSGCSKITLAGNQITNSQDGIRLRGSYNTLTGNNVTNSGNGILLLYSRKNTISKNNLISNKYGIWLEGSSNNTIYHNNFVSNTHQVYDRFWDEPTVLPSINIWDDGYPSGGNYWSDYTGSDGDGDTIGDTSYVIDENNQDRYPLMDPLIHDITIIEVTPYEYLAWRFGKISILVTVKNYGFHPKSFVVTLKANTITIGNQTVVNLAPGATETLTFIWDIGFVLGDYWIIAMASAVPGETEISDNTYTDGKVHVSPGGSFCGFHPLYTGES